MFPFKDCKKVIKKARKDFGVNFDFPSINSLVDAWKIDGDEIAEKFCNRFADNESDWEYLSEDPLNECSVLGYSKEDPLWIVMFEENGISWDIRYNSSLRQVLIRLLRNEPGRNDNRADVYCHFEHYKSSNREFFLQ